VLVRRLAKRHGTRKRCANDRKRSNRSDNMQRSAADSQQQKRGNGLRSRRLRRSRPRMAPQSTLVPQALRFGSGRVDRLILMA
jgi:hypothetical protein